MYDVCIIGAGPAGISSAVYAVSRGLKTVVLEQSKIGGLIGKVSTVTHYVGVDKSETGESFSKRLKEQADEAGVEIVNEKVIEVDFNGDIKIVRTDKNSYEAKTVIIAAGTTPRNLGIPGEKEFAGRGTMLNAAKDGKRYEGKEIFVVGGADGAIKEALYLAQFAKKLTIIHFEDTLGAIPQFTEKVREADNIELELHKRLTEIRGNDKADELVLTDVHDGSEKVIRAEGCGIFIYAGSLPETEMYRGIETENGYIITNDKQKTNIYGVYAAGDICKKQVRQVATAVSEGAVAAINAAAYVNSHK